MASLPISAVASQSRGGNRSPTTGTNQGPRKGPSAGWADSKSRMGGQVGVEGTPACYFRAALGEGHQGKLRV
ncbi:MAG: hypothetical protein H6P99_1281 [Holophagaceae bacterium]|nr:hypothetical protein [Holophagaceae bacterium]